MYLRHSARCRLTLPFLVFTIVSRELHTRCLSCHLQCSMVWRRFTAKCVFTCWTPRFTPRLETSANCLRRPFSLSTVPLVVTRELLYVVTLWHSGLFRPWWFTADYCATERRALRKFLGSPGVPLPPSHHRGPLHATHFCGTIANDTRATADPPPSIVQIRSNDIINCVGVITIYIIDIPPSLMWPTAAVCALLRQ